MEGFLVKISNYKKTKNTQYWHLLNGPVTKVLVREKIGRPLKILVLQWTIFPWNIGLGGPFFQGQLVRETNFFRGNWSGRPFFSGNIGLWGPFFQGQLVRGTIFFRGNWSGDHFFQGKLVRETISFREYWSGDHFSGKIVRETNFP